ncbi:hypothetical protein [Streptomyces sp. NWU49]|uniref:hypothetical protein n=1 Tax=Streptomyces sp. NWU49 TaxID=2201153 RepID=UPI00215B07AD|nr:hypothetical protein [Streptomyces sp. NWU49]
MTLVVEVGVDVARDASGRWRTPANDLYAARFDTVSGGNSTPPEKLDSGIGGDPATALNADGRVSVFYRGSDGAAWHVTHQSTAYTDWARPASLGGQIKDTPAPVLAADGKLELFVRGSDDLWLAQQKSPDAADWTDFTEITTGLGSDPKTTLDANARIRVFWRGSDGQGYYTVQQADYDTWQPKTTINGVLLGAPHPVRALDGRLEVLVTGTNKAVWVSEQNTVNTGSFSSFTSLAGSVLGGTGPRRADRQPHRRLRPW